MPAGWVTADEVYGQHSRLRRMLEERQMPYVLAVPVNQRVIAVVQGKVAELRADALATVPAAGFPVAPQLPTDRGRAPSQVRGDRPHRGTPSM